MGYKLGVEDIRRVLKHKKRMPKSGQDIERYFQVLQCMNWQLKYPDLPRKRAALNTATRWGRGKHAAENIIHLEKSWIKTRSIALSQRGKHAKSQRMLNDEGTLIAVREYLDGAGESKFDIELISCLLVIVKN